MTPVEKYKKIFCLKVHFKLIINCKYKCYPQTGSTEQSVVLGRKFQTPELSQEAGVIYTLPKTVKKNNPKNNLSDSAVKTRDTSQGVLRHEHYN